ncbi:eCIS core domain-containing protein [Streptomyces tubercidicus]|uniref:eCIS core domain-containing protein n=1 Tax=Streptomyces tubercidicus TaxID=47759 RepID=UPI0037983BB8
MSTSHSATQDNSQATAAEKRRKRRERNAKSRTPEPKDIVSGAGQPLDLSVRRDLEEQLGHDFSQVRLHTDRDSGQLAEMMGADAFAVGQDIFFREGTYRPGTADGQRLLAHELLHTVQNPHGLGALRAGRDLGAVSLPQEAIEREAESAAQESVLGALRDSVRTEEPAAAGIGEGQATPGWLRYATVDADRMRMEQLDPATLVDRLANDVVRSLRGDPEDWSGRVRLRLAQMSQEVQESVLDRLEVRLLAPEVDRLLDLVEEAERSPLPLDAAGAPEPVRDEVDTIREERVQKANAADDERKGADEADDDRRKRDQERKDADPAGNGGVPGRDADSRPAPDSSGKDTSAADPSGQGASKAPGQSSAKDKDKAAEEGKDKEDGSARQEEQAEAKEQDKESASEDKQYDKKQDEQQKAAQDKDNKDKDKGAEEEDAQERSAEQQEQQPAGEERMDEAGRREGAAAPGAVDKSAAEPGEKDRTGSGHAVRRTLGDPENEEDADDEPLGLEDESAELDADEGLGAEDDEGAASGDEPVPDVELEGATPAAKDPSLAKNRRDGNHHAPQAPAESAGAAADSAQASGTTSTGPAVEEEAAGDGSAQDLQAGGSNGQEFGPDSATASTTAGALDSQGPAPAPPGDTVREKAQSEEHKEDAEAKRRDEEARNSDGSGAGQAPGAGETAPPGQLAKADEDARRQTNGSSSGTSTSNADGGKTADGSKSAGEREGNAGDKGTNASGGANGKQSSAESGKDSGTETASTGGKSTDKAQDASASEGGAKSKENASAQTDTPDSKGVGGEDTAKEGDQDVTGGKGPATAAGPQAGPEKISTAGPSAAPKLSPGNGPSPASPGPEAKDNAPKSGGSPKPGPRPKVAAPKRQAARQATKNVRRSGGGGGRTASAPAPARGGSRGGGGRGASAPSKPKKDAPAPDVSKSTPEAGLATASKLKPYQMVETLKGVDSAVATSVDKERTTLRKGPPKTQRPSGSPKTLAGGPTPAAPGTYTNAKVSRTDAAKGKTPEINGEDRPRGEVPGGDMEEPSWWDIGVTIGAKLLGKVLKEILPLDDLIDSILGIPTVDEGMKGNKVGDAPGLPLQDDSDPQRTYEQGQKLDDRKSELHQSGREDAARPMGEDQIYPDVPKETLTGKVPVGKKSGKKGGGPKAPGGGAVPIESASAVAEHDRGKQIQAGFGDGRQKMGEERKNKDQKAKDDKHKHDQDLKREVDGSGKTQANEREKGQSEISSSREKWRKEQDDKVEEIDGKKGKHYDKVRKDIDDKQEKTDKEADKRTEDDNKKIDDEQDGAKKDAEKKQDDGKQNAGNWLDEAISKLKEMFEKLVTEIKNIFKRARKAVTDLIDRFKEQVFKLIDAARNWVIQQINDFADTLIALGDELLADYPAMRDKWRNTIDGARDYAVKKVNEAADALKDVAGKLLDGLCSALVAGLDILESGLLSAVDVVKSATVGALEFGKQVVAGLGEWAAIFNDIVSDPGGWISKAGAAAETGAKEYLFDEIKAAIKEWFNQKVQEIIGIPMEDFQELISGGVTAEEMGRMAWDEALPQLPVIIGVMVMEKVVAKLIPGAGWVMAIIDALQAAWGALSEILRAFGLFMDFLKSVKSGNGARPFAKAVAAGVVALLELIYQALIEGVSRFMGGVTRKLGDMLQGIRRKKNRPDAPGQPGNNRPAGNNQQAPASRPDRTDEPGPTHQPGRTDKPADHPAPNKPSPDKASRPKPGPRPSKRPSPEKKPSPTHQSKPKKKRDEHERREDGREVNATRRRMQDAKRKLRDEDDRPTLDKRRGPGRDTLKKRRPDDGHDTDRRHEDRPDLRKPDAGRPDKRRPDGKNPDKNRDRDRDKTKDKDGDDRPKPDLNKKRPRRRPESRTRRKLRRARQTIKSALNRARRAARKLHGKGRKLGRRLNDRSRRMRDQWRRQHDRDRNRERAHGRDRAQDRTRDQEPNAITDFDLPKVRFRTNDGEPHTLLFNGRGRSADLAVRSILQTMSGYFDGWQKEIDELRQNDRHDLADQSTQLLGAAQQQAQRVEDIQGALPKPRNRRGITRGPLGDAAFQRRIERLRDAMEYLAELLEQRNAGDQPPPLPQTILPPFSDGPLAFNFKAKFIKKSTPKGTEAHQRTGAHPVGWKELAGLPGGLAERQSHWVRMHMLPTLIGGQASTSNLVPALGSINTRAAVDIEHPAQAALGHDVLWGTVPPVPEKMIWYQVAINYRGQYPGFPRRVSVKWGGYKPDGGQWKEQSPSMSPWAKTFPPPNIPIGFDIRKANAASIRMVTRVSEATASAIARLLATPGQYNSVDDLAAALLSGQGGSTGAASNRLHKDVAKLIAARNKIRF